MVEEEVVVEEEEEGCCGFGVAVCAWEPGVAVDGRRAWRRDGRLLCEWLSSKMRLLLGVERERDGRTLAVVVGDLALCPAIYLGDGSTTGLD
jgi:hypothetical protein